MGAFYLYHESRSSSLGKVKDTFELRGFPLGRELTMGPFKLLVYRKMIGGNEQILQSGEDCIGLCGTMIYKGLGACDSLRELFADLKSDRFEENQLIGQFLGITYIHGEIQIITDRLCTLPLYHSVDHLEFSSSFLALLAAYSNHITVNMPAMLEIFFGKGILPPDTQVDQVRRWVPALNIPANTGISVYRYRYTVEPIDHTYGYNAAVERQIARLDTYFVQIKKLISEQGVCLGLTGGFDSRLLLAMLLRHGIEPECYTHWQNGVTPDFQISSEIAGKIDIKLKYIKEHIKSATTADDFFKRGFMFTDGQIRPQYFWNEIYSTSEYYQMLGLRSCLGFNGVGGEQYRNSEGFPSSRASLTKWLVQSVFYNTPKIISDSRKRELLVERYTAKVATLLQNDDSSASKLLVKRYHNEIYGYANRYYRAGFENQIMYHLSPFSDPQNSLFAYQAIPHLGGLFKFQMDMIQRINPELAGFRSHYGFPFNRKAPLSYRIGKQIQRKLPHDLARRVKNIMWKSTTDLQNYPDSAGAKPSFEEWIDYSKLPRNYETQTLLEEMDYFVDRYQR